MRSSSARHVASVKLYAAVRMYSLIQEANTAVCKAFLKHRVAPDATCGKCCVRHCVFHLFILQSLTYMMSVVSFRTLNASNKFELVSMQQL
jgi:hypothetical protein